MSGIGPITPAEAHVPVEEHQPPERDGGKDRRPRRTRSRPDDADMVEAEPHKVNMEA
jgi:hypothetical protein